MDNEEKPKDQVDATSQEEEDKSNAKPDADQSKESDDNKGDKDKSSDINNRDIKDKLKINTEENRGRNLQDHEGYDEIDRLGTGHVCKKGWLEMRPRGKVPEKRSHHTGIIYENWLYIYGGEDSREGKFESLWKLDLDQFIDLQEKAKEDMNLEENKDLEEDDPDSPIKDNRLCWNLLSTKGAQPGSLSHHQAGIIGDEMYIYGGMQADGECNGNLYSLNMKSLEWRIIHPEGDTHPEARDDHSMTQSDNELFVFGGFVRGKRMNDIYKFSCDTKTWECIYDFHEVDEFSPEDKQKEWPCPRSSQDMVYYNGSLYIFGGRNDYNDKLNDTWQFNISSKSWSKIECEKSPIGRSSHALVVDSGKMILFGGIVDITKEINEIEQFDFSSKEWATIDDKSEMHKYANINSPVRIRDKMNETAPLRQDNNELTAITMKRETANKSMKKLHTKKDLSESDEKNKNFHLLKDIPKFNKKKSPSKQKREDLEQMRNEINTPITGNLRNTFVIKNHNDKFDQYYTQMKRKKGDSFKGSHAFGGLFSQCLKPCDRPTARDGHSLNIYKDRLYVFGGDRHHMPYNDTFSLELK